jgi:ribosomal protein L11 methylase PrmA
MIIKDTLIGYPPKEITAMSLPDRDSGVEELMNVKANKLIKTSTSSESGKAGWCYRLGPELVLGDRKQGKDSSKSDRVIVIKSGRAFPLGHPTTRLCLDLLTGALAARPGESLVEVGCGTGVICLAAAALGIHRVVALDIDRRAVRATRWNARENGLAGAIRVVQGSSDCLQGSFGLVVANLPWEIQMDKVLELHHLRAPGGRLILSGFRDNQEEPLLKSYQKLGWTLIRRLVKYFTHPELPAHISFNWAAWLLEQSSIDYSRYFNQL